MSAGLLIGPTDRMCRSPSLVIAMPLLPLLFWSASATLSVDRIRRQGECGLARRREQLAHGVALHADVLPALAPWAEKLGVALPAPLVPR
jgi:hypothetical protein